MSRYKLYKWTVSSVFSVQKLHAARNDQKTPSKCNIMWKMQTNWLYWKEHWARTAGGWIALTELQGWMKCFSWPSSGRMVFPWTEKFISVARKAVTPGPEWALRAETSTGEHFWLFTEKLFRQSHHKSVGRVEIWDTRSSVFCWPLSCVSWHRPWVGVCVSDLTVTPPPTKSVVTAPGWRGW